MLSDTVLKAIEEALGQAKSWRATALGGRPPGSDATGFEASIFYQGTPWRFVLTRWTHGDVLWIDGMASTSTGLAMRMSLPALRAAALKAVEKEPSL